MNIVRYEDCLNSHDPQWTWLFNDRLYRGPMSPEHEKLFSILCVLTRAGTARRKNSDQLLLALYHIHQQACFALTDVGTHARVSLRVRSAMEQIVTCTTDGLVQNAPYKALDNVLAAAVWGAGKSKLLTAVSDKTWMEQCAGRAQLAIRRGDYPGLTFD